MHRPINMADGFRMVNYRFDYWLFYFLRSGYATFTALQTDHIGAHCGQVTAQGGNAIVGHADIFVRIFTPYNLDKR